MNSNSNSNNNNKESGGGDIVVQQQKQKQPSHTCCTPIGLNQMKWNVVKPTGQPIPPFSLTHHPLAIIIGWIDASPKYVERYNKLYRDNGFCTLSLIPSSKLHFLYKKMKELALNFLNYLLEIEKDTPRPIIIQVFSGNALFLSEVYHILKRNDKFKMIIPLIKGQIFDSCPSSISEMRAYNSLVATKPPMMVKIMAKLACRTYSKVVDVDKLDKDFWSRLSNSPILSPQLYYYSYDDQLTSYQDVEKGISIMRKQGIQVSTVVFDKSKHVNHLGVHPVKYLSNLYKFLESTLKPPLAGNRINNNKFLSSSPASLLSAPTSAYKTLMSKL
ncbi:prespore-specific protein [Cavenderia fasciculata]|uniref:Prespore-specific protein n=1 Tax=Cavenderia fasciculata TaxID=261658 RepID=F4PRK2_CACFS|nr:prespore-specific protein [Cavenderia fasciculata]EGG21342.1 prespore-specific protein [Cavenderia fasciculata]|eukprot:XP_004359192.1 prespore-specific protein [Cavenderia fasciculata]